MRFFTILLMVLVITLAACTQALPQFATPTAPASQTVASEQLNLFATQTQSAASVSTATAQAQPIQPAAPLYTPSPLPESTQVLGEAGPFRQVSRQEALILGKVLDLQAVDSGLLLFSEGGISFYQADQWTGYFIQDIGYPAGVDPTWRAWVAPAGGAQILQSDSPVTVHRDPSDDIYTWTSYGPEAGWSPVTSAIGSPVNFGLVTDSRGVLWLSTAQDVRSFDGAWQVHDAQKMGMPASGENTSLNFTLSQNPLSREIYVGRCDWGSNGPVGGGGWRVFDGLNWSEPDPALSSGCVSAFAQDDTGRVWIAQDASLWRFDPASGSLEQVQLPEPPQPYHFGYFTDLNVGPDNSLWTQMALCSEVDCFGGEALYRLREGAWQPIGEPSPATGQKLLFDRSGIPWLLSGGGIYQVEEDTLQPVPGLLVQAAATDDAGNLWLLAQASGPPTLWKLNQ